MENNKLCPIMAIANSLKRDTYAPYCIKRECAWWSESDDCCSMTAIPPHIKGVWESIDERMPADNIETVKDAGGRIGDSIQDLISVLKDYYAPR